MVNSPTIQDVALLPQDWKELLDAAVKAQARAYAPYSTYKVGCAVETESGEIFLGCNIENVAYTPTICAERVAVGSIVAAKKLPMSRLLLISPSQAPTFPCGLCRQVLYEFAPRLDIVAVDGSQRTFSRATLDCLLPFGFDQAALRKRFD